ncbi:entericidin A/B family lipoprotein [Asticcacaulis sp. BYS171W]|uniref:Entericidin A/B family lipoprotein n=1 Tax=Asticcacaulis aquaticus TaxID=2984212 RepID=A0ABT5HS15_9CAUL|nr:entericidin A/B family lipoprotein [Asticcacaulis aquaticus]MDC7682858.1 entericidin A/B family lipoprotein [Asticcacaulis aquaticus]
MITKTTKLLFIAGLALAIPALNACNTIEGAGKDVEKTGEVVQDAAKDAKN